MPCSVRPAPANSNTPSPGKKLLELRMAIINVQLVGHFSVLNNFCEALRILVTWFFFFERSKQGK